MLEHISREVGILLSLLWGAVVFELVRGIYPAAEKVPARAAAARPASRWPTPLARLCGTCLESAAALLSRLPLSRMHERNSARLARAGMQGRLTAQEFLAAKVLAIPLFGLAGMLIDSIAHSSPVCLLLLAVLGVWYPDIWLSGRFARRESRIFRELPDVLDVLRLAVAAGLDFSSALHVVVESGAQGPLLEELGSVERDIALGDSRGEALQKMADRLGLSEINAFVLAVRQADELGASIGPLLRIQSEMARQRRWQLAEVLVGKLPTKLLGPLVLCIFPASFLILFTPLVLDYLRSGF